MFKSTAYRRMVVRIWVKVANLAERRLTAAYERLVDVESDRWR